MKDVLSIEDNKPEIMEKRESVRGKLEYYQELIHQNEKRRKEEGELEL